jgi:colanic acid/amylovoran biosynthesis glycosyltransferase
MTKEDRTLVLMSLYRLPAVTGSQYSGSKKWLDEILLYAKFWPGKLRLLIEQSFEYKEPLETIQFKPEELPFTLEVVTYNKLDYSTLLNQTSIVSTPVGYQHNDIGNLCKQISIPCIYCTEYTLKTRRQIIDTTTQNPLLKFRRYLWEQKQEQKQLTAIASADGVQCNGTPTYEIYSQVNSNAYLYFDNRITDRILAKPGDIENRLMSFFVEKKRPLGLLFSGRLTRMKGADQLIDVADELKQLGIRFHMYICGEGELKSLMNQRIEAKGLSDCITMKGMLKFSTELIPLVKKSADLFVCCHPQGDPSCTYIETMACGVPIIGYANEALTGIIRYSGVGWTTPLNQPKLLAQKIAEISNNFNSIREMSFQALDFAKLHTFEHTYKSRVEHLYQTMEEYY